MKQGDGKWEDLRSKLQHSHISLSKRLTTYLLNSRDGIFLLGVCTYACLCTFIHPGIQKLKTYMSQQAHGQDEW